MSARTVKKLRVGVLASGRGSNLQAIIDAIEAGRLDAQLVLVLSNKQDAVALERARKHGLTDVFLDPKPFAGQSDSREAYDRAVLNVLRKQDVELVLLAGYMKIVTPVLVKAYENRTEPNEESWNVHVVMRPNARQPHNGPPHRISCPSSGRHRGAPRTDESGRTPIPRSPEIMSNGGVKPMDTPPTLAMGSQPALNQSVHPLRSKGFWVTEALLVWICVSLTPGWTMWREGNRITGPIVTVRHTTGSNDWVTVQDPATELLYTALMTGHSHHLEDRATVIVHPTDPSMVKTPNAVNEKVGFLCACVVLAIALPVAAVVGHRRRRST